MIVIGKVKKGSLRARSGGNLFSIISDKTEELRSVWNIKFLFSYSSVCCIINLNLKSE